MDNESQSKITIKARRRRIIKTRRRRIIKTPKPFKKLNYKCYYIKITGIDGKRKDINLCTADKKEARLRAKREIELLNSQLDGSFAKVVAIREMVNLYVQSKTNWAETTSRRNIQHLTFFLTFMNTHYSQIRYFNHINQSHIEEFQTQRLNGKLRSGKSISPKTVRESVGVINNMFEWAIKRGYALSNPVKRIEKVKVINKDQHRFTDQELLMILEYCKNRKTLTHMYAPYLILITTGLRSGELSNLIWDDIGFERRVIKIRNKTLPDGREWNTKTRQRRELKMEAL